MNNITVWALQNEKGEFIFNHIEDGHCLNPRPTAKTEIQKKPWSKGTWKAEHCHLSNDIPPKLIRPGEINVNA